MGRKGWWGGSEGRREKMADREGAGFCFGKLFFSQILIDFSIFQKTNYSTFHKTN